MLQDPFDAVDFVERMAWRMTNGDVTDPLQLKYKFEDEIHNLQLLCDQFQVFNLFDFLCFPSKFFLAIPLCAWLYIDVLSYDARFRIDGLRRGVLEVLNCFSMLLVLWSIDRSWEIVYMD